MAQALVQIGGANVGGVFYSWPLARLTATSSSITIEILFGRSCAVPKTDVSMIRRGWVILRPCVEIHHSSANVPQELWFVPWLTGRLIARLQLLGYPIPRRGRDTSKRASSLEWRAGLTLPGNTDRATPMVFTPLVAGTVVAASPLDQLFGAVDDVRVANGNGGGDVDVASSTDVPAPAPGAPIRGHHLLSLRSPIDAARTALGFGPLATPS